MKKILDWLIPTVVITFLLALIALLCFLVESQYAKYVKEWEDSPAQQTLQIDALYFPDDGITACAADLCYNSRFTTLGEDNQLHLTKRDRMNWGEWILFRLGSLNEIYEIEIELNMGPQLGLNGD